MRGLGCDAYTARMLHGQRPWREELKIIDDTMRTISSIRDPEKLVEAYWNGIGKLVPVNDYVSLSRRNVEEPYYLITRSSMFTEDINPWTERHRLPKLKGGVLGEIAYANAPVMIEDLAARLKTDDPAHQYLGKFASLVALPQYDNGQGLNVTVMLSPPGKPLDMSIVPMMHWQAGLFGRGTTNLVLRNQLSEALAALDRELQVVGEIQRSLLPAELPAIPGFDVAARYETSARAGGDYYDFFPLPDGRWGVFIADVSGHGTPAAVLMAITHAIAHAEPGSHTPPGALLAYLNRQLERSYTRVGGFVTAWYGVLDPRKRTLTYSSAGHNPPRLARACEGEFCEVESIDAASSIPLGIDHATRYTLGEVRVEAGDMLVIYTDGITEAMHVASPGSAPDLYGVERLDRVLAGSVGISAMHCVERIWKDMTDFTRETPPSDDRTLIVMKG